MIKILSVDTCLKSCSVAIHQDEKLIGEFFLNNGLTHSQTLIPMVEGLLKQMGLGVKDVNLFSVVNGPGSFTGVRIGMAAVKGMAFPFETPCVTISSLRALALGAKEFEGIICPCIDARNNQIYNAIFKACGGKIERITKNRAIEIDDFINEIQSYEDRIIFVGDAAEMCYNISKKYISNKKMLFLPEEFNTIRAGRVGEEAFKIYSSGCKYSFEEIKPQYLKLSQAERQLDEKKKAGKIKK